jgi:hypothetical protein
MARTKQKIPRECCGYLLHLSIQRHSHHSSSEGGCGQSTETAVEVKGIPKAVEVKGSPKAVEVKGSPKAVEVKGSPNDFICSNSRRSEEASSI